VRVAGLAVALPLTRFHTDPFNPLPTELVSPPLITAAVVLYEIAAAVLFLTARGRALPLLVLFLDGMLGAALTYFFGPAYLLLSFTLPVLGMACFFNSAAGWTAVLVGGLVYGVVLAFPFVGGLSREGAERAGYFLGLTGIQGVLTLLLLWLYSLALLEGEESRRELQKAAAEKEMLYQEMRTSKAEVGQIYAEIGERESAVRRLEAELASVREELETVYKRLHEARTTVQATEQMAQEKEQQLTNALKRERTQLQKSMEVLQRKLERQTRLLELFRELATNLSVPDLLLALTEHLQALLPCQSCIIFLVDEVDGHRELFAEVAASPYTDYFRSFSLQMGEGAPGFACETGQAFKIDSGSVTLDGREITTLISYEQSAAVCPMSTATEVLGAVYLGRSEPNEFSQEDLELLTEFCQLASLALFNALTVQRTITSGIHDPLTQLYNSQYLEERMREEVKRGRRYTYPVSLLLVDIDNFGQVGEKEAADTILKEVAEIIRQCTRETDVPARLDGDDFAILLVHSDRNNAYTVAERIRSAVDLRAFGRGGRRLHLTASVGVAGVPHDAINEEQLTMRAAAALQRARSQGGNLVSFWNGSSRA
jgi:diguanylate cyclase (GGDEF)-like protein